MTLSYVTPDLAEMQRAVKQGAFDREGTPGDPATIAGCSAYETGEPVQAGVEGSIPSRSTNPATGETIRRFHNDPRYVAATHDDAPVYKAWEHCAGQAEIIGRDGPVYSSQFDAQNECWDLFDHSTKRFVCEDGVRDLDHAIDILNGMPAEKAA